MTIKVDDEGRGPGCYPTLIVEVRLYGKVLRDLIVEAIRLTHGSN